LLATGEETASKEGSQEERAEALDGEDENRSKEQSSTGGQESVMDEVSEEKTENIDEEWQEALETQREAEALGDEERQAAPLDEKKKDAENTVSQPSEEKNIKTDGASGD
jgi:hypothetical protein